jgi:cytochrome c553
MTLTDTPIRILTSALLLAAAAGSALAAGDPARGQQLYAVCSICHGQNGEGLQEMNAPALAGREDWYLVRQIENFRSGVRGSNPADVFGLQMAPMAKVLADKQAIEDVAAYLSGLDKK